MEYIRQPFKLSAKLGKIAWIAILLLAFIFPAYTPAMAGPGGPASVTSATWYDGLIQYSMITNCVSIIQGFPYQENGVGTYVGFYVNSDTGEPKPNTPYYVHIVIAGLGNACSGMRAYIDLGLPENTSLAIDGSHPVYCFYDGVPLTDACPQGTLPNSGWNPGMYMVPATTEVSAGYTWPIPQGRILEIQIPVISSTTLSNRPMQAKVWMLDGNSSPWLNPQQGVYVFSSQPTTFYPSPSTINIVATTAKSQAYLYTYGIGGTGYFDLGTDTSYSLIHDTVTIVAGGYAWLAYDDWGPPALTPDTLYHWRFRFTDSNGISYYGSDQTFRTLPDGQATVGSGSAASCTPAALSSALGTAKTINFDCGTLPVTITLSSAQAISSNVKIDGGNKVTLDAQGTHNHFNVQNFWHLTLENITLVNGYNSAACGGAIHVFPNAFLTVNGARFFDNTTISTGGAICVDTSGAATIKDTLFSGNHANGHGGAIRTYGLTDLNNSVFTLNTAGTNGGGIDNTNDLYIVNSTFNKNTAGVRGGAINNYLGNMTMSGSTIRDNISNGYGGGIANDAGTVTLQDNQISGNTAASVGGGVRNNGTLTSSGNTFENNTSNDSGGAFENVGTLTSTNDTLSANHAAANGGGVYWNGGTVTLLNVTLNGNTAGTQGGNIYAGSAYNANLSLKNTLVAAGSPNNCSSTVVSNGYNLESANTCGLGAAGDIVNTDQKLGPLQDNGGATWTHALLSGSPAIDAGTNSGCPATDQRGVARPWDGNGDKVAVCDIGAYETHAPVKYTVYLPLVIR